MHFINTESYAASCVAYYLSGKRRPVSLRERIRAFRSRVDCYVPVLNFDLAGSLARFLVRLCVLRTDPPHLSNWLTTVNVWHRSM
jgi:hypothetical protein